MHSVPSRTGARSRPAAEGAETASPDHSLTVVHRGYGLRRVCGELSGGCRRDRAGDRGWVGPFAGGGDAVGGRAGAGCVAPGCGVLGVGGRPRAARGGWERFEAAGGGDELAGPGAGALEVQLASAGGESETGGGVHSTGGAR